MCTYHYTYLITNLYPAGEERYYIGVHSGSERPNEDNYMGSSSYLQAAIKEQGIAQFEKIIIQEWDSRNDAERHENLLHSAHNASRNSQFYNRKNGVVGFHVTPETTAKAGKTRAKTVASKSWNDKQVEITKNFCKTVNSPQWKITKGKEKALKISEYRNGDAGQKANTKHSQTINDPLWKATIGAKGDKQRSELMLSAEWKNTVGKELHRKKSKTMNDPAWIAKNTYTCPHCGKTMVGQHNFNRWHNDNCKQRY